MSGDYVDGGLYRATFKYVAEGDPSERVVFVEGGRFRATDGSGISLHVDSPTITNIVGPLRVVEPGQVVLDLPKHPNLTGCLRRAADLVFKHELAEDEHIAGRGSAWAETIRRVADQIESQLPKPRIPEPGWGAVVEAGVEGRGGRFLFTQHTTNFRSMWQSQDGSMWVGWDSLTNPVVKREAVES